MHTRKIIFKLFFLCTIGMFAQDVHFSQLNQSQLLINPANAGNFDGYSRAVLNYRTQWSAGGAPYQTIMAAFDANAGIKKSRSAFVGFGGFIYQDKASTGNNKWSTLNADFMTNIVVNIGKSAKLSGAIGAGLGQTTTNNPNYTWGVQYDGTQFNTNLPNNESFFTRTHFTWFDLSSGVNLDIDKLTQQFTHNNRFHFRIGFAGYHLNAPKLVFATNDPQVIARRFVINSQARFDIKESPVSIMPSLIYMWQGTYHQLNLGTFVRYRFKDESKTTGLKSETALHIGGYYRVGDAFIPQFMLEVKSIMFGFSYDQTVSNYKSANRGLGAFEVSLSWTNLRNSLFKQRREFEGAKTKTAPASSNSKDSRGF
ncbi:MAG TPA: PorP/SprF family type IX secretion system membrane protein [Bacteroidia bacterium]|jgi:type IX secretion system PorP/SprF family membrane protein|nr:PorP/SprF family type IX secretion system membrane protein [Bacteroidia bacterium]